jgi:hypothetical protein
MTLDFFMTRVKVEEGEEVSIKLNNFVSKGQINGRKKA